MPPQQPLHQSPKPSHPGLIQANFRPGDFASYTTSLVHRPAGSFFASLGNATRVVAHATYATVQVSKHAHLRLDSDLLYTNHSCKSSLEFDTDKMEVRVARETDLGIGDRLTFFYPSTEWEMAQPFECGCGEQVCLGRVDGAKRMDREQLRKYWLNRHIRELLDEEVT